jgi:hypothetical protein
MALPEVPHVACHRGGEVPITQLLPRPEVVGTSVDIITCVWVNSPRRHLYDSSRATPFAPCLLFYSSLIAG